jgi:leucyl/phenylalanyl-tRNA--protein transferase
MPASRYPDWESFRFPGDLAGPHAGSSGPGRTGRPGPDQPGQPVAFCSDLSPASVLSAYRRGIVPIPAASEYFRTLNEVNYEEEVAAGAIAVVGDERDDPYWAAWWSPDPRPLINGDGIHLGRNVRKRLRRDGLVTTADTAFRLVTEGCRAGREPRWLTDELLGSLTELHAAGWAHSIEVWLGDELVGGALGIGIGGVLSGDSLFGRRPGAAAIAVADMRARLVAAGGVVIDAQWDSPFLRSLGAAPVAREDYLALLDRSAAPLRLPGTALPALRLLPA